MAMVDVDGSSLRADWQHKSTGVAWRLAALNYACMRKTLTMAQIAPCEGAILGGTCPGMPDDTVASCTKWLNGSICRFGCGLVWGQRSICYVGSHWYHLENTTELSTCYGNAAILSNYVDYFTINRFCRICIGAVLHCIISTQSTTTVRGFPG